MSTDSLLDDNVFAGNVPFASQKNAEKRFRSHSSGEHVTLSAENTAMMSYFDNRFAEQANLMRTNQEMMKTNHDALLALGSRADERLIILDKRVSRVESAGAAVDDRLERKERENDILIRGVPLSGAEDWRQLNGIVVKLANHIGLDLRPSDIVRAHRIKMMAAQGAHGTQRDPLILVRFGSLGVRQHFFDLYLAKNEVTTACLGYRSPSRIFISDNLTKKNVAIRARAVELKRNGKIAHHTVRDGLVRVVLTGNSRRVPVSTVEELEELVHRNIALASRSSLDERIRSIQNSGAKSFGKASAN